ncbi:MAG TPA: hypothetical protein VNG89_26085 [Vicinamibacterales bacterium]|nr:hypothetical protein [Vicinamibacterales bacterium]
MKLTLLIGAAALAVACGGSHQSETSAAAVGSSQPSSAPASGGDQGGATQTNQTVTLVGCLVGPGQPAEPTGTAGTRAQARATGPETAATIAREGSGDRFMLVDAVVPGADLGGKGANGAGASGGPLVSGRASFELDAIPADARGNVNKRVRIVGRLDARPIATGDSQPAAGTSGSSAAAPTATGGGTSAAASPGGSGSSDAAGAHGTGQKSVAGHGTMGSAARSDLRNQRLVVETIEVIAPTCGAQS